MGEFRLLLLGNHLLTQWLILVHIQVIHEDLKHNTAQVTKRKKCQSFGELQERGRKDMFYLRKEGNVLFNNTLNTFCFTVIWRRNMVKDHSNSERKLMTY